MDAGFARADVYADLDPQRGHALLELGLRAFYLLRFAPDLGKAH